MVTHTEDDPDNFPSTYYSMLDFFVVIVAKTELRIYPKASYNLRPTDSILENIKSKYHLW